MNKMVLMLLTAVSAPVFGAGWESALQPSLYSVTFAQYVAGERLSDKGATGGAWKAVPALSLARAAKVGGREGAALAYVSTSDIAFDVTNTGGEGAKAFRSAVWMTAYETAFADLPKLTTGDKFAFSIWAPENGAVTFIGWTSTGWQKLHLASGKLEPKSEAWYDLSVWLVRGEGGRVRVQYRLKVGDDYEPLLTEDGAAWMNAGGGSGVDEIIRGFAFRGEGAFDATAGRELPPQGISVHFR